MPRDEKSSCDPKTLDADAARNCALLAAAMVLKPIQVTYFAASLLAEYKVKIEHAVKALALHDCQLTDDDIRRPTRD